ncbi:MAG: NAD(P)H-binding protein [Dehalococcoidia bacterium]
MILVAGGTGFVGGGIVRELARRGKPVAVMSRSPQRAASRFPGLQVEYRQGDVRDPDSLASAVQGAQVVIASITLPNLPIENRRRGYTFDAIDAAGTERLVTVAKAAGVGRFIYLSGAGAAPDARYHWHRAKWRAETAIRQSEVPYVIFRPSWVYGPEDKALNRFLRIARLSPVVPVIGDGNRQRLQPVFVDDVAWAVAEAVEGPAALNKVFEIGGPEVLTMNQIIATALAVMSKRRLVVNVPKGLVKLAAFFLQFLPGPPLTPNAVDFITMDAVADNAALAEALGFQPRPLRDRLAAYLAPHH